MKMPLEYVLSNAGYPMLVVDRFAYHKHSTSPKTNRTIWRCSRRRVKDIRCTSACNTFEDEVSKPSPHDPNCYELTKSELMLFNSRKEKMNMKVEAGLYEPDLTNKSLLPTEQDCTISKLYDNTNQSFKQNEQQDGANSKLFDYTTNVNNEESVMEDYENMNEHNSSNNDVVGEYDENGQENMYNYTENGRNDYHDNENDVIDQAGEFNNHNDGCSDQNDVELDQNGGSMNGDYPQENYNAESDMMGQNEADYNGDYLNGTGVDMPNGDMSNSIPNNTMDDSKNCDYTMNESKFDQYQGNLQFVTSKVGHPMLVVDGHTFHKHSTNPKTGRVNWRCARRRVKDIRCSSSCYTQDGISSVPKPHDPNCFPIRNIGSATQSKPNIKREMIKPNTQTSTPRFINTKAESYNSLNNRKPINNNSSQFRADIIDDGYDNNIDTLNGDQYNDEFGQYSSTMDNHHGNNDEYVSEYNGSEEYIPYNPNEHGLANDEEDFFIESLGPDEYNIDDYSQTPESFAQLISDLNKMKQREKIYSNKINTVNSELKRFKKQTALQLQSFKWRTRMMEIDMGSLKANFNQKNMQNSHLRKLVADMMSKLKTSPHDNVL